MIDPAQILEWFEVARDQALQMLLREGVTLQQAAREAPLYVSPPIVRANHGDIQSLRRISAEHFDEEYIRLNEVFDLGSAKLWDLNFNPPRSAKPSGADPYITGVADWTRDLKELRPTFDGVVFATSPDGDYWTVGQASTTAFGRVRLVSHENGVVILPVAESIMDLLDASHVLAAGYYALFDTGEANPDRWIEKVIEGVHNRGVNPDWLHTSLASRPRPT